MDRKSVVILHGYSGEPEHVQPLADFLKRQGFDVVDIWLGDYISMTDEITIQDLGQAMGEAIRKENIPEDRHSFDVVVHSTGGLVVRQYLLHYFFGRPEASPIRHLIMLAPANFGSPLARMGKSMVGRLKNGWDWNTFMETGTRVLNALEPASPITFKMAELDLFNPSNKIFTPEHMFTTVLVGTDKYSGLPGLLHKNGSDGTVYVSTANLNAECYKLVFNPEEGVDVGIERRKRCYSPIAFGVLYGKNHGSITLPGEDPEYLGKLLIDSLTIENSVDYEKHLIHLTEISNDTFRKGLNEPSTEKRYHKYQHLASRVHDQFGEGIDDYFLEFFQQEGDEEDNLMQRIHGEILESVKVNSRDKSYRSLMFDITDLEDMIVGGGKELDMSLCAAALSERIRFYDPQEYITVVSRDSRVLLNPNTTLLVDIELPRIQSEDVFKMRKA